MQSLQNLSACKQNSCEIGVRIHLTLLLCARERNTEVEVLHNWPDHFACVLDSESELQISSIRTLISQLL
jgi:hypothetical protein